MVRHPMPLQHHQTAQSTPKTTSHHPHPPFTNMGHCEKALPCPGNIVGGAKRCPTTLPGHGSAFLQLPHWCHPCLSPPFAAIQPPSHQTYRMSQIKWVGKSYFLRPSGNRAPTGTNKQQLNAPPAPKTNLKKHKNTASVARTRLGASW